MTTPAPPPDPTPNADTGPSLEDLVAECIELFEQGQDDAAESRLSENPEHEQAARRVLQSLRDSGMIGPTTFDDAMPERLGDFRLIRRLGRGGMGVVYLARQETLDRLVAVKVIHPSLAAEPRLQARFEREARAIARLDHPNVVRVYDSGNEQGHLFIAMEFIAGESLAARCDRERPTIPQALEWIRDIARALQSAHDADLVHRDVKPANILLHSQRGAVLLDFGLARDLGGETLTVTDSFQGSPYYASPEQVRGHKVGPSSDVYSLGVTLYECVTGVPPFKGETTEQVFHRVLSGTFQPVRKVDPSVPADLEIVIHAALERDPVHRLSSAAALADDLDALLTIRPIRTRPPGPLRRMVLWSRRHRLAASMILLALLVSITAIAGAILTARFAEAERRDAADAALDRAREQLAQYVESSEDAVAFEREVVERSRRMAVEFHEDDAWRELGRDTERQRQDRSRREDVFAQVFANLDAAASFPDAVDAVQRVRARAYFERWRISRAQGDAVGAAYYRRKVEELDARGTYADQLAGRASVQFRSEPAGAEVFVLKYEDHGVLYGSGEPRLVPVPIAGEPPIRPGTWCLRVVEAVEPLEVGDLISEVAGHPVEGSVIVGLGQGEVKRLDRLTHMDGAPITSIPDYRFRLGWELGDLRSHTMTFAREGEEFTIDVNEPAAFRVAMGTPAEIAARGDCEARVVRGDEVMDITLPAGLHVVTTASPIFTIAGSRVGVTPVSVELVEGPHVAVYRWPDGEVRVPFDVFGAEDRDVRAWLPEESEGPPGFVAVAYDVEGVETPFWIQERELTFGEYVEFLNDPYTQDLIRDAGKEPRLWPREMENVAQGGFLPRGRDGRFGLPTATYDQNAVLGISHDDIQEYLAWRNEQAVVNDEPFEYFLPTLEEYDAVRRASRFRAYPNGTAYRPRWYKGWFSQSQPIDARAMSYPIDELPPGVFDLAGGVSEWTSTWYNEEARLRLSVGGSWMQSKPDDFRLDYTHFVKEDLAVARFGFRLVARLR